MTVSIASLRLAVRMLARDWRAGELTVLGLALVLAVAALTSVGFLTDRVERALDRESHQLLGGDLLFVADHPWDAALVDQARAQGLTVAQSVGFPSMIMAGDGLQLADIKAVGEGYPLRGKLRTAPAPNLPDNDTAGGPPRGEVWPDERLVTALGLVPGATVRVGRLTARVGPVLTQEPDRGLNVMALAPRLMIHLADLEATQLVLPGSRITWRLHVAGDEDAVKRFAEAAGPQLGRGERMESLDNARPEVRNLLERAQRFLRLAALLAVVLAAVAVALSAQRYLRRHLDGCAVMRCLGAREAQLLAIHGGEFLLFGMAATVVGCLLGYGVQAAMLQLLAGLLFPDLPAAGGLPWLHGMLVGLVLLAGFALPPLLRLKRVPTIRVLRREFGDDADGRAAGLAYLTGAAALGGLMVWIAADVRLGLIVLGGFAAALVLYAAAAAGLLALLGRLRPSGAGYGWRHGLASLRRHRGATVLQAVAIGLGLTALLLLTVARGDLLEAWRKRTPADAPNRFVVNIQPDQRDALSEGFRAQGLAAPALEPMVRGRLMERNDRPVTPADYTDERAQRLVEREFNLSWAGVMPAGNRVVAGRWHGDDAAGIEFSVEQGLAQTLGLGLGDRLTYVIGGERVTGTVTSLRALDWDSMRVNFFVIASPGAIENYSASFITSFHLPAGREKAMVELVRAFPNLTVIDVGALVLRLQRTLDQVSAAVQLIFGFALLAGIVVLLAALQASGAERRHDAAVLRALGARQTQLARAWAAEFAALGLLAGLLASVGASAIGWALATWVFRLPYAPNAAVWVAGLATGCVMVSVAGAFAAGPVLRRPALASLREG